MKTFLNRLVLLCILLTPVLITILYAYEIPPSPFDFDVVLVIDDSGSMRTSDIHDHSMQALRMFIHHTSETDTRVGIVLYSDERRQPLRIGKSP